jgi:hypothetical protein
MANPDPQSVIVDKSVKAPNVAVELSGKVLDVRVDAHTGLTTVDIEDQRGAKRAISFKEPMGVDAQGQTLHHPLAEMVDTIAKNDERESVRIKIDGKGNTDFAVGSKDYLDRGHTGPDLPKDLAPNDPRVPAPDKAFIAELEGIIKEDDLKSHMPVRLDFVRQPAGVEVAGTILGMEDRDGVKTLKFEQPDGTVQRLSFDDPVGQDHAGKPVHHPLASMADNFKKYEGAEMRLKIDPDGKTMVAEMAGPLPTQPATKISIGSELDLAMRPPDAHKPLEKPKLLEGSEQKPHAPAGTTMEQLLKPTGPNVKGSDGQDYVQLGNPVGSLRVQTALFDDFKKAETYLGKSKEAVDVLYNLEHPPKRDSGHWYERDKYPPPIEVQHGNTVADDQFSWGTNKTPAITWAPNGGLGGPNGVQSPAMPLLHEAGHAVEWQQHEARINQNARDYKVGSPEAQRWTTPEERRNIDGMEARVARELGEPLRHDHGGYAAATRGPISREAPAVGPPAPHVIDEAGHANPRLGVSLNDGDKPGAISAKGKITGFEDHDGVKSIEFLDTRGAKQTLRFNDPAGFDPAGNPVPNPLGKLANEFEQGKGSDFRVDVDPSGRNVIATVGPNSLKSGQQVEDFAEKLAQQQVEPVGAPSR